MSCWSLCVDLPLGAFLSLQEDSEASASFSPQSSKLYAEPQARIQVRKSASVLLMLDIEPHFWKIPVLYFAHVSGKGAGNFEHHKPPAPVFFFLL